MTDINTASVTLRIVDGGLARPETRPEVRPQTCPESRSTEQTAPRPAYNSVFRWMDWMPMALLGFAAGLAGILQIASAIH